MNKDLFDDPKDYTIAKLKETIARFKAYDEERKKYYSKKMVRLGELESYVIELKELMQSAGNGTLVSTLQRKIEGYKQTVTQLNKYITIHKVKTQYSEEELDEIYAKAKDILEAENQDNRLKKMKAENDRLKDTMSKLIYRLNSEKRR